MKRSGIVMTVSCLVILLTGGVMLRHFATYAVTDSCSFSGVDVPTEFDASYPASVKEGESFTVSNIRSKPSTSYGVTVYKSNLRMSATNSTPASYNKDNASTDPSPTTDASTYTAYYPNWNLKATGPAGSSMQLKLVSATATISNGAGGQVDIPCDLSATLASIPIVAKTASTPPANTNTIDSSKQKSSKPSATNKTDKKTSEEEKSDKDKKQPSQNDGTEGDITAELPGAILEQLRDVLVTVHDSSGNPAPGASVTIDDQLTVETGNDGIAKFENIRLGDHRLKVVLGSTVVEQSLQVGEDDSQNTVTVKMPSRINLGLLLAAGTGVILALSGVGIMLRKRALKHRVQLVAQTPVERPQVQSQAAPAPLDPVVQSTQPEPVAMPPEQPRVISPVSGSSGDATITPQSPSSTDKIG